MEFLALVLFVVFFSSSLVDAATRYLTKPYLVQNATEGGKLHLRWTYELDAADESTFDGVTLGKYFGGGFTETFMKVNAAGIVLTTSNRFDGRLTWNGDLSLKKIEFVLNPVNQSDAVEFTCGINLGAIKGFVETKLTLIVYVIPKITWISKKFQGLKPGESTSINCTAVGKPQPLVSWNRMVGSGVYQNLTLPTLGYSNLVLNDVTIQDRGDFACIAKSLANGTGVSRAYLNVFYLAAEATAVKIPVFSVPYKICCPIRGYPDLYFTWNFPNGSQTPTSFQDCITVSDFGKYSCEGFNVIGKEAVEVIFGPETTNVSKRNDTEVHKGKVRFSWLPEENVLYYTTYGMYEDKKDLIGVGIPNEIEVRWEDLKSLIKGKKYNIKFEVMATTKTSYRVIHEQFVVLESSVTRIFQDRLLKLFAVLVFVLVNFWF